MKNNKLIGIAKKYIATGDHIYSGDIEIAFNACPTQKVLIKNEINQEDYITIIGYRDNYDGTYTLKLKTQDVIN